MASEKENVSNGTKGQEQELYHDAESHQWSECPLDTPKRAVVGEAAQPLSSKENVSGRSVPLGDECYSTPARLKAEEKSYCELAEKQRRKSVDFATVTTADFGITPESFVNGSTGKSPAALKLRRRSAIGARGSPENNTLIQYLAQQKSNRQKEALTQQASPCQFARSLKSKMDIFQRTFKSVQEAEGKTGFSGLSQASTAFQEGGFCLEKSLLCESSAWKSAKLSVYFIAVEQSEQYSPKRAKKKKVTFGEDLSPEIFDKTLPANTPVRKGSKPICRSGSEHDSPFTRAGLTEEPLAQPNFDCSDVSFCFLYNYKNSFLQSVNCSISRATSTKNAKDTKNPRKNGPQRPKSVTVSAAKKKQVSDSPVQLVNTTLISLSQYLTQLKTKHATFGKRRKRKVKKSLYGERETASKKPLLSPILEIPEVFSGASSPNSPKEIVRFPGNVFSTEETASLKEKTGSDFLIEHEKLQGDFPSKEEWLIGLELLNQKDIDGNEMLQRTECPPTRPSRRRPSRSRSAVYIPPIEKSHFEMTGDDLQVSSFDIEEILSAPQLKSNSLKKPLRRKSSMCGETRRVRRSMRLQNNAETEGLAWIEVTNEILQNPSLLAPACKTRRRISTFVPTESENIHHREENVIQFAESGKENSESVHVAAGPCRRRRKSTCESISQETRTRSQNRKRSITNSVYRRDSSNQEYSEEMNIPLPNSITT
uniref:PP1-binding domain-containing protein n=1 Tax=Coturnix japonica TaxID=93934 RepID=A0A8C2TMU4_COTJA